MVGYCVTSLWECPLVVGWLLCTVMTLLGSLFGVLTASDVEVPLGQNLETCVNPRQMVYG